MTIPKVLLFQQRLLLQLSVWSLLSVFLGGVLAALFPAKSFWSAFGGMNAVWGLVNLVIASVGFYGVMKKMRSGLSDEEGERRRLLRLLRVNTWLDVGYVAVGAGLAFLGKTPLLHGFGWGVILQGGFLLLFDWWHYRQGGSV
ncbi:MAG: hypothetical protein RMM06_06460 [Armatimonadota bacterium]|nr:hypothetical protein [bacterium]MCS7309743.1 hypothetical protein [Armatimonadota bacterium]MDW8104318.1 hypothetical protein [Armatimonadota bacterium]MDW8290348.1 hypothetical protein [Armatimonadota bacterium]